MVPAATKTCGPLLQGGAAVACRPHKPKVVGSNPALASKNGGSHAPSPSKAGPMERVVGGLNTSHTFVTHSTDEGSKPLVRVFAPVAQLEEHPPCKGTVRGSNPRAGSTELVRQLLPNRHEGRLENSSLETKGVFAKVMLLGWSAAVDLSGDRWAFNPRGAGSTPAGGATSTPNEVSRVHLGSVGRPAPTSISLVDSSTAQRRAEQPAPIARAA